MKSALKIIFIFALSFIEVEAFSCPPLIRSTTTLYSTDISSDKFDTSRIYDDLEVGSKAVQDILQKLPIVLAASLIQISVMASPVHAEVDIAKGSEIFTGNCAGCHGGGMNFVKPNKDLKKETLQKFVSGSLDKDEVKEWVMKSGQHSRMVSENTLHKKASLLLSNSEV